MIIAFFGALAQAACLGEMASMIPVAGAQVCTLWTDPVHTPVQDFAWFLTCNGLPFVQYHWTWHLAPHKVRRFATWIQGWTTWFGYIALQASLANVLVVQLESVISLNSTSYVAGGWHTSLLVIASVAAPSSRD